jgi:hypothetical protein
VSRVVAWLARHGGLPPGDLLRASTTDVDDDDLVVLPTDPHLLADVVVRH